jgi:hypothetical protein
MQQKQMITKEDKLAVEYTLTGFSSCSLLVLISHNSQVIVRQKTLEICKKMLSSRCSDLVKL